MNLPNYFEVIEYWLFLLQSCLLMLDALLKDNGNFSNFGIEHGLCFTATILFIVFILYMGSKRWNLSQQQMYITIIMCVGAFTQLFKVGYRYYTGVFDQTADVPLHLCNIMTLVMPLIMWYKWRNLWGITFFWIIAGCAQSIFTPTLTESLPHYEAIRYWMVHGVIILGAFYGWYVYGYKPTVGDAIRSAIGMNLLAAVLYPINLMLGANYMYLNAKPPGATFYDLLGPWPTYILMLEFVIIVFFSIILIPFHWDKIKLAIQSVKLPGNGQKDRNLFKSITIFAISLLGI